MKINPVFLFGGPTSYDLQGVADVVPVREWTVHSQSGVPLRAFEWGDRDYPAAVIINAYGSRMGLVSRLAERLAREKHVISWESRWVPCVASGFDRTHVDVADHVADASHVMNFFERRQASVLGFCTGAQVAVAFAAAEPERVEQIALLNGNFSFSTGIEHTDFETFFAVLLKKAAKSPQMAKSWFTFISGGSAETPSEAWARLEQLGASDATLLHLANSFLADDQGEQMHRYALMMEQFNRFDVEAAARKISALVFVFSSQQDKVSHPANSIKICHFLQNAQLIKHQESGHYALYDSPSFIDAVATHLTLARAT